MPQWALITIIFLITAAWLTNFLLSVFNPNYHPPSQINTAFITIVGAILVNAAARYRGTINGDSKDDREEEPRLPPAIRPPRPPRHPSPFPRDEHDDSGDNQ